MSARQRFLGATAGQALDRFPIVAPDRTLHHQHGEPDHLADASDAHSPLRRFGSRGREMAVK
jgi:hypothetical protein